MTALELLAKTQLSKLEHLTHRDEDPVQAIVMTEELAIAIYREIVRQAEALREATKIMKHATQYKMNGTCSCFKCRSITILDWADGFEMCEKWLKKYGEEEK